jgi:sortase B
MEKAYWQTHRKIRFDTQSSRREYEIILVAEVETGEGRERQFPFYDYADFYSEADFEGFWSMGKKEEAYDTGLAAGYGDKLILLATCVDNGSSQRLIVLGRQVVQEVE